MQLTQTPYNRLVPYEAPERSGEFCSFFEDDEVQTRIQHGLDETELNTLRHWYAPQGDTGFSLYYHRSSYFRNIFLTVCCRSPARETLSLFLKCQR